MTSWYAFPNPLLHARRNLYHPLAPSHAPDALCARCTPPQHASQCTPICACTADTLFPPLAGPQSSCASSWATIGGAIRISGSRAFTQCASCGVRWSLQVPYFRLTSLQCVPRRAPPMLTRAMFTYAVTPELLVWCPKWSACTVGVVWECRSVKIPVYRAY